MNNKTSIVPRILDDNKFRNTMVEFEKALQNCPNNNKYLIVSDLDGTLLNNQSQISFTTVQVIKTLINAGHTFCFATGRPWRGVKKYYEQLNLNTLVATLNGSIIYDPTNEQNEVRFMFSIDLLKDLMADQEIMNNIENIIVEDGEKLYIYQQPSAVKLAILESWFHVSLAEEPAIIGFDELFVTHNAINAVLIEIDANIDIDKIISLIKSKFKTLNCQFWRLGGQFNIVEVNTSFATKGNALKYFSSFYGINLDKTIAFGDGMNDVSMLVKANYGYAMKNAKTTAKFVARGVTKYPNEYDGLAQKLVSFFTKIAGQNEPDAWFVKTD